MRRGCNPAQREGSTTILPRLLVAMRRMSLPGLLSASPTVLASASPMRLRMLLLVLAVRGVAGCATPEAHVTPPQRVAVRPFLLAEDVRVRNFDAAGLADVGPQAATWIVRNLTARRYDAAVIGLEQTTEAELTVSGIIHNVDGGSVGFRRFRIFLWLICWPCGLTTNSSGNANLAISGVVTRPEGSVVGRFDVDADGGGPSATNGIDRAREAYRRQSREDGRRGKVPP